MSTAPHSVTEAMNTTGAPLSRIRNRTTPSPMAMPAPHSAASHPKSTSEPWSVLWMYAMPMANSTPPPNIDTTSPAARDRRMGLRHT